MWYVIQTVSGQEKNCMQQCMHYIDNRYYKKMFIPQYIEKKHFKKEWHDVKKILFPGYLFVDTVRIEAVAEKLKKVSKYTKLLKDGDTIAPITEEEKSFLEMMMDDEYVVRYSEGFIVGEKVCIISGPLKNCQGWIKKVDRHKRLAKMEIPIFGRRTPVEVGFGAIARISEDELKQIIAENAKQYATKVETDYVKVISGVFTGMTGKFLYADPEKDEWTVELELFGAPGKVVFKREELSMFV